MKLHLRSRVLELDAPLVMGVLNVTPDSFSDGGRYGSREAARRRAREMVAEGAAIIDVGGESTRPGAEPVAEQEELDRVMPVIEDLVREGNCVVSIDTMKPAVMQAACAAGAELINDVYGLRAPGALHAAREAGAGVCLMHMQGEPRTMQQNPRYANVVEEVRTFLAERLRACREAGIPDEKVVLDPGFGFGKTLQHNLRLLGRLDVLASLNRPLMVGVSRKSMFQHLLGLPVDQRLAGGLAAAAVAVLHGAVIVRAHDVKPTVEAVKTAAAIRSAGQEE